MARNQQFSPFGQPQHQTTNNRLANIYQTNNGGQISFLMRTNFLRQSLPKLDLYYILDIILIIIYLTRACIYFEIKDKEDQLHIATGNVKWTLVNEQVTSIFKVCVKQSSIDLISISSGFS